MQRPELVDILDFIEQREEFDFRKVDFEKGAWVDLFMNSEYMTIMMNQVPLDEIKNLHKAPPRRPQ